MVTPKRVEDFADQIGRCVRCGACQTPCPAYCQTLREGSAARGKIALAAAMLAGEVALDERLQEELGLCLLCGACVGKCPNQVETDAIVAALRRQVTEQQGLSPVGRGVAALTGSPPLLKGLLKGADLLAPLLFKTLPKTSGLHLRFGPDSLKDRTLPPIPARHLFARMPAFLPGQADKPVVGFFAGCALSYLYPDSGEAMIRLLNQLGYAVLLPRSQGCCGMPALSSGNGPLLAQLAERNLQAFANRETAAIITGCASSGGMLAGHYADLDESLRPLAESILDIHVFLAREGLIDRVAALPKKQHRIRVAYHDPCHLRGRGITREPRALLRALPQIEYIEMEDADLCCGLGGTFSANHPDLSRAIGDRKLPGLIASRAEVIATACPGCVLQLQDIVTRAGLPVRALHTMDLLAQALAEDQADAPRTDD